MPANEREAVVKPECAVCQANRVHRFCWRCAPDRGSSPLPRPGGQKRSLPAGRRSRRCRRTSATRSQRLSARCIRRTACAGFAGATHQIAGQGPLLRPGGQRRSLPEGRRSRRCRRTSAKRSQRLSARCIRQTARAGFAGATHQIAGQGPLPRPGGQRRSLPAGRRSRRCRRTSAKRSQGLSARCVRRTACAGFAGAAHQIAGQGPLLRPGGQRRSLPAGRRSRRCRRTSAKRSQGLSARCVRRTACAGFAGAAHQIAGQGPLLRPGGQRRSLPAGRRSRRCRRTSAKRSQRLSARCVRRTACAGFAGAARQIAGQARSHGLAARNRSSSHA